MNSIFEWISVVSAVLLMILILIQTRGASLGSGMGGGSEINTVRRGSDKSLHQFTVILVITFGASLIMGLLAR